MPIAISDEAPFYYVVWGGWYPHTVFETVGPKGRVGSSPTSVAISVPSSRVRYETGYKLHAKSSMRSDLEQIDQRIVWFDSQALVSTMLLERSRNPAKFFSSDSLCRKALGPEKRIQTP